MQSLEGLNRFPIFRAARGYALLLLLAARPLFAHETDQFSVPVGRPMADLRHLFAEDASRRISDAVVSLNERIERSLQEGKPTNATRQYYSPAVVARTVYNRFPSVIAHVEQLESRLHSGTVKARYPGLVVAYRPTFWVYHHPLLVIDPTKLVRLKRCSTAMVDGHYFGTDKYVHFVHMGHIYYESYTGALKRGASEQEAVRSAIDLATGANLFLSENTILGMFTTGIRSNADLAANYCGFKFFRNLTEPVMLKGAIRPPLLVRDGLYWKLADHVRPNSDFFAWFISDHWDEALLPNVYLGNIIAECVRQGVKSRCPDLLEWYRDENGMRRSRDDFFRTTAELRTYYGEDYGFKGNINDMVTIATVCFDTDGTRRANGDADEPVLLTSESNLPGSAGRAGSLYQASCDGDMRRVQQLLGQAASINETDLDGQTALHCAVRWGHAELASLLLGRGANVNAQAKYGLTPLHIAVREYRPETVRLLLEGGANANAADEFGCTPLHDAAGRGYTVIAAQLLQAGAEVNAADSGGTTPLHRAARGGYGPTVQILLKAGADGAARNTIQRTPADEAGSRGHDHLAPLLQTAQ